MGCDIFIESFPPAREKRIHYRAAYAAFQENRLGSIEKGKYADFTVIDRDILTVESKQILDTQVLTTFVNGEIQFQSNSAFLTLEEGAEK